MTRIPLFFPSPTGFTLPERLISRRPAGIKQKNSAALEKPGMSETRGQFEGLRGFLRLAVGFLLLAAAIGSAIYILVHLVSRL